MYRTVRPDMTVVLEHTVYGPRSPHSEGLMRAWIGRRVFLQRTDHWGMKYDAMLRWPAASVMDIAQLELCDTDAARALLAKKA